MWDVVRRVKAMSVPLKSEHEERCGADEGRALVQAARHTMRTRDGLRRRHLYLCDNLSLVLAVGKGRSSAPNLNGTCRALASLALFTGSELVVRWVPSEVNPADGPSRRRPMSIGSYDVVSKLALRAAVGRVVQVEERAVAAARALAHRAGQPRRRLGEQRVRARELVVASAAAQDALLRPREGGRGVPT